MTKELALELSNILKAYSEGKIIQILCYGKNGANDAYWKDFDFKIPPEIYLPDGEFPYKVRVKPESKLIPFTFEDKDLFIGKIIKHRRSNLYNIIVGASPLSIWIGSVVNGLTYFELWENYEFEDGSPCGKLIE